ncbi:transketolase family protein [Clostridioides difficile]|uniref:transketolase family protein n=1 Tax=Clostridioides difficile TaxID=1496 RepID=UPI000C9C3DE3|nr:transketolase C-terminal domain-containing protein [Clostridioides difficile]MDI3074380.1 transketolase C-terminal domain-containing protein [Clostridioides difficile]MDK3168752.1 transketolase C-terminal domain-containing protein [Clostridioides difficile]HBF9369907.1 transketolase family protein [Clostridioides difficile]HBG1250511.1 transketolase family protein [Clostridioides difficile]HBG4142870.1 transketolase family protein [Clostridioides difficile]
MNNVANRKVICDTLVDIAKYDKDIMVLTSDSRGSASMSGFAELYPEQFVEVGIAEQNLVGIASGLASCGKKTYVASPACFLSMRSIEQIKVDVAYSKNNVKLIGISGGVSYGALGMTHHSLQDIAVTRAIPGIQVLLPADRYETKKMIQELYKSDVPAYIRIGRNPVEDVYENEDFDFKIGKANELHNGNDITVIATGETVRIALDAAIELEKHGIRCRVINMHTIKPLDEKAIIKSAKETKGIITIEEHSIYGGLGAAVSEVVVQNLPTKMKMLGIADESPITGNSKEVFNYYGLNSENIVKIAKKMMSNEI